MDFEKQLRKSRYASTLLSFDLRSPFELQLSESHLYLVKPAFDSRYFPNEPGILLITNLRICFSLYTRPFINLSAALSIINGIGLTPPNPLADFASVSVSVKTKDNEQYTLLFRIPEAEREKIIYFRSFVAEARNFKALRSPTIGSESFGLFTLIEKKIREVEKINFSIKKTKGLGRLVLTSLRLILESKDEGLSSASLPLLFLASSSVGKKQILKLKFYFEKDEIDFFILSDLAETLKTEIELCRLDLPKTKFLPPLGFGEFKISEKLITKELNLEKIGETLADREKMYADKEGPKEIYYNDAYGIAVNVEGKEFDRIWKSWSFAELV